MVEASAHSMPCPAFLAFAVLGAMSQNPAPGFSEMVSPDDGPPTGPAAEAAGMAIQKGTASRRSLKREADEEAKQAKRPKVEGEGGAPGGAPLPPPRSAADSKCSWTRIIFNRKASSSTRTS